jgi:hypothetical protein
MIKFLPLMAKLAKILQVKISVYTVTLNKFNEPQPMIIIMALAHDQCTHHLMDVATSLVISPPIAQRMHGI